MNKATHYLQSLDQARCNGSWDEVPELARKVEKHAPSRKTLALVARSEALVTETPYSDIQTALPALLKPLQVAIQDDKSNPEDIYQARVCLAWVHWRLKDQKSVIEVLSISFSDSFSSEWSLICTVKQIYLKGFSYEKTGDTASAAEIYDNILPLLLNHPRPSLAHRSQDFRIWTERVLCRYVARAFQQQAVSTIGEIDKILHVFHIWISLSGHKPTDFSARNGIGSSLELGMEVEYSRWDTWISYYELLSRILRMNLVYEPRLKGPDIKTLLLPNGSNLSNDDYLAAKLKQRTELKGVEYQIQAKLMQETIFPKADVRNEKVERWADAVMENWKILCGPNWHDDELGEGGKNAIARGVLDILYDLATKTFHSTLILRHLFSVHAYLAEFDLAMGALDTYLTLVQRARSRTEKSGEPDFSLDRNDKVLSTMAEAIVLLCKYGELTEVEKAHKIAARLERWVKESEKPAHISESTEDARDNSISSVDKTAAPSTIAQVYHALGISEAHWGRMTHDESLRQKHQEKAQGYFQTAVERKYGCSKNVDYLYSLAASLAEMRNIQKATNITKLALLSVPPKSEHDETFMLERKLIKFWHLLTLLLTAQDDTINAAKTSTAAFDQFQEPATLFGQQDSPSQSMHTNTPALVDVMSTTEKIEILQVKITQVALLAELEGANSAVERSMDLLASYVRLFGRPSSHTRLEIPMAAARPMSRLGSIRAKMSRHTHDPEGGSEGGSIRLLRRPGSSRTNGSRMLHSSYGQSNENRLLHSSNGRSNGSIRMLRSSHGTADGSIISEHVATSFFTPTPTPAPVDSRLRVGMLIELWLFISQLYCDAGIVDQAKDAVDEAEQTLEALELEMATPLTSESSAKKFSTTGWGGGKSVDEMHADILAMVSPNDGKDPRT